MSLHSSSTALSRVVRNTHLMKRNVDTVCTTVAAAATESAKNIPPRKRSMKLHSPIISLSPLESRLRHFLTDVAARLDALPDGDDDGEEKPEGPKPKTREQTVLRFAGGWVRDKLLGIACNDIDVAINNRSGEEFALGLRKAIDDDAEFAEKHGLGPDDVGHLHLIRANPEKSKHLETATARLFGLAVDFVNLRKETYLVGSRIPKTGFGTLREDARRRDATINAMFYNLHTGQVEDVVDGWPDLSQRKLIRTPLDPLETFQDDPLRVLRLIRFSTRLGFAIDAKVEDCMRDGSVVAAFSSKISKERVGVELEKMLKGPHPRESLHMIDKLNLYDAVFTINNPEGHSGPDTRNWKAAYDCLDLLAKQATPGSIYQLLVRSDEDNYISWLLAALAPYEGPQDEQPDKAGFRCPPSRAARAARDGIKVPARIFSVISAAHWNRSSIMDLFEAVVTEHESMGERDKFGMAVRAWDSRAGACNWRLQVLSAILVDAMAKENWQVVLEQWQKFLHHLEKLGAVDAVNLRPLIDGKCLAAKLGVRPGKWMSAALDAVLAWQLRNPGVADADLAVEEVKKKREELGIPPA